MPGAPNRTSPTPDPHYADHRAPSETLQRYALLADQARDIVLFVRPDGRILEANRAAATAYGYSPAELATRNIQDLRAPETHPLTAQQLAQAETEGLLFETLHRRKDGLTFPVEVSSRGAVVSEERVLLSVIRDITDRRQAEDARRRSEEKFAAAFRASPDGIAITTRADGRVLEVNPSYLRLTGYTREEVLGRTVASLGIWAHPEERARLVRLLEGSEGLRDVEVVLCRKDGEHLVGQLSAEALELEGVPCMLTVLHDITARKQAEAALTSIAKFPEENPQPVLRVRRDGTLLYANPASAPLLHLWGCAVGQCLPASWQPRLAEADEAGRVDEVEVPFAGRVYACRLVPIAGADYLNVYGRDVTEEWAAAAMLRGAQAELEWRIQERTTDLDKTVDHLRREVAARRAAEEQLQAMAAALTRAEQQTRSRLATTLHEEHQQLLVAAKLALRPLEQAEDPPVREASRGAAALLAQALEHSRAVTRELSPPILYTGGLPPALEGLARELAATHGLRVAVQADARTATAVDDDLRVFLFQATRELLLNVVKHAQVDTAQVSLRAQGAQIQVVVADQGVGFDPAHPIAGAGLGRLRQRLVLLGGRLDIASTPGQGSRITLSAPLQAAGMTLPSPTRAQPPERPADPARAPSRPGTIRVLVVDDHQLVRQALVRLLQAEPDLAIVGEAADGQQAIELTRQLRPDLVTMDVRMPGMDGIAATRVIHAECPAVRVIGLSMFEIAEQADAMRAAGAVAYLSKSGPAEALLAAIRGGGAPPGTPVDHAPHRSDPGERQAQAVMTSPQATDPHVR